LAKARATGVRSRDPPTTTLPGEDYQTLSAEARARAEGTVAAAPPSPVSLAQGDLATPLDELRDTRVERVSPASPPTLGAEALPPATEETQDALARGMVTPAEAGNVTQVTQEMENLTLVAQEARSITSSNPTLVRTRNLTTVLNSLLFAHIGFVVFLS